MKSIFAKDIPVKYYLYSSAIGVALTLLATTHHSHAMSPCQLFHGDYVLPLTPILEKQACILPGGGTIEFIPQRDIPFIFLGTVGTYVALAALASQPSERAFRRLGRLWQCVTSVFRRGQQPQDALA